MLSYVHETINITNGERERERVVREYSAINNHRHHRLMLQKKNEQRGCSFLCYSIVLSIYARVAMGVSSTSRLLSLHATRLTCVLCTLPPPPKLCCKAEWLRLFNGDVLLCCTCTFQRDLRVTHLM